MSVDDFNAFERELRTLKPAAPPAGFIRRLETSVRQAAAAGPPLTRRAGTERASWWRALLVRWLVPAAALITLGLFAWRTVAPSPDPLPLTHLADPAVRADEVRIDQTLLSSFDAITRLPDGEPVRIRCQAWVDDVVLKDSARGVEVRKRSPRLEVIPVRFETY